MDYGEFEIEDFLLDETFQNYCLGRNEKDVRFWENWISSNSNRYPDILRAKELYFILNGNNSAEQIRNGLAAFRSAVEKSIPGEGKGEKVYYGLDPVLLRRLRSVLLYTGSVAAAVLGIVFLIREFTPKARHEGAVKYVLAQNSKDGERKSFQLPDGSKVMLNSGSSLIISKEFNKKFREVSLAGEGFFNVTANARKPFIIHTSVMDIKVLGTIFNVKAYPADELTETSLLTGLVEVTLKADSQKVILHANQKIILSNSVPGQPIVKWDTSSLSQAVHNKYRIANLTYIAKDSSLLEVSWTANRLAFNDNSFEEIALQLQRWYNVPPIVFEDEGVKQFRFTAIFDQESIEQVLNALQLSRHFKYSIKNGNQIYIGK